MPFEEGNNYGNRNGRPKGSPNKSTQAIRDAFQCFVEENLPKLQDMFDDIKRPQDKLNFLKELSEYILPKLSRTEVKAEIEITDEVDLTQFKTEDLKKAIEDNEDEDKS